MQPQVRPAWQQCLGCSWTLLYKPQCRPGKLATELCGGVKNRCSDLQMRRGALQGSTVVMGLEIAWLRSKLGSRARNRVPSAAKGEASNAGMNLHGMPLCDRKLLTALVCAAGKPV